MYVNSVQVRGGGSRSGIRSHFELWSNRQNGCDVLCNIHITAIFDEFDCPSRHLSKDNSNYRNDNLGNDQRKDGESSFISRSVSAAHKVAVVCWLLEVISQPALMSGAALKKHPVILKGRQISIRIHREFTTMFNYNIEADSRRFQQLELTTYPRLGLLFLPSEWLWCEVIAIISQPALMSGTVLSWLFNRE